MLLLSNLRERNQTDNPFKGVRNQKSEIRSQESGVLCSNQSQIFGVINRAALLTRLPTPDS